jgi:hypothetical protein
MTDTLPAYSAAMDITLALLPWTIIWKLTMRKMEKIGVAIGMSMGILSVSTLQRRTLASGF